MVCGCGERRGGATRGVEPVRIELALLSLDQRAFGSLFLPPVLQTLTCCGIVGVAFIRHNNVCYGQLRVETLIVA